jgi:hypothetical protein
MWCCHYVVVSLCVVSLCGGKPMCRYMVVGLEVHCTACQGTNSPSIDHPLSPSLRFRNHGYQAVRLCHLGGHPEAPGRSIQVRGRGERLLPTGAHL